MLDFVSAEDIVEAYGSMVFNIAAHMLSSREDAEDVYSETFLNYFRKEWSFESEEHRRNWFIRVTINCSHNLLRNRSYSTPLDATLEDILPDTSVQDHELEMDVHNAIERLPSEHKEIVALYYLYDLSIKDIAEILDIKEGTVKSRLYYAREKLSQYFSK